ncbi:hypothetical protein BBF96_08470 [Anoxybacter fermentans]|uniref:HTH cro/C1-type domain-containing protein n=1 Tax=Anoxybacter fermentans TaxID=1323375 RepID=A0A3S9SYR6_9FIRM|nr:helix-turn-helix transcriptional regulator [Anoxybacter fermentans]AZR73414.1 hypothetical protein BBF96_08470 [Anoxybacter fermentans]
MTEELKILGEKLAQYRDRHGLTLQDVGKAIGVSKGHASKLENGNANPSFNTLIKIAEFMKIPLYYLFMPTEEMNRRKFIEMVNKRLEELKWDLEKLQKATGINYFRLADFMQGNNTPTVGEMKKIASALEINFENILELKFGLFENLLLEFGLNDSQINNLIEYIKTHMK